MILKLRGQNSREDTIFVPRRWKKRGGKRARQEKWKEEREVVRVEGRDVS